MSFIRKGLSCMDEATFFERHFDLRNGDYIGAIWCTGTSSKGGLGVIPKIIVNLSCCLYKMPPPVHCNTGVWTPGSGRYPDAYILNDQVGIHYPNLYFFKAMFIAVLLAFMKKLIFNKKLCLVKGA
ncbi:lysine--tRNA ligase, cytoplasmic-like isoform X2 [Rutidosis leptorrhynchoides]|uniref:lysine--tRNA ligase, cytoplasmic-like isoform X2 n=1 Tax=Rutidosis leptorrhynchoides TaxID=125765 RepID=UPI003A99C7B6